MVRADRSPVALPHDANATACSRCGKGGLATLCAVGSNGLRSLPPVFGSQIIEDGMRRSRKAEHEGTNTCLSEERQWSALLDRRVLSRVHRYPEVANGKELREPHSKLTKDVFKPPATSLEQTFPCSDVMSFKAQAFVELAGPHHAARSCNRSRAVAPLAADAGPRRLHDILRCGQRLIKPSATPIGTGGWLFALGEVCAVMGVGWPALAETTGDLTTFKPDPAGAPQNLFVVDAADWVAMEFRWVSPVHQAILLKYWSFLKGPASASVTAVSTSQPRPFLECAAEAGFWRLSAHWCHLLARHLGVDSAGMSAFEVREVLVKTLLGIGPNDVVKCSQKAYRNEDADSAKMVYDILDVDNLDALGKDEQKEKGRPEGPPPSVVLCSCSDGPTSYDQHSFQLVSRRQLVCRTCLSHQPSLQASVPELVCSRCQRLRPGHAFLSTISVIFECCALGAWGTSRADWSFSPKACAPPI